MIKHCLSYSVASCSLHILLSLCLFHKHREMHVPSCCLASLEESFGLAGCSRGNSSGSNVLRKGPSVDQGPGIPATHRLLCRDSEGPGGMNVTVPQMVLLQSGDRLWLEWYFKYHHAPKNKCYTKHMCMILRRSYLPFAACFHSTSKFCW